MHGGMFPDRAAPRTRQRPMNGLRVGGGAFATGGRSPSARAGASIDRRTDR